MRAILLACYLFLAMVAGLAACSPAMAEAMEWVRVAEDRRSFVLATSGESFVPWGFNYDHDQAGRLLEDYWEDEWERVEADFREMKQLGANVVRIHLQFGRFMQAADKPNETALNQLARLVRLAETTGLYLDLTGLGCYHKQDVPAWYDKLDRQARWQAQAVFWEAVAGRCRKSPAIFCYDLMNEPVVPGGAGKRADWLGGAFGDKHFVQFIALETAGRPRPEIAQAWIETLVAAVRRQDRRHLVTVGLVPWSLDRPGLTSGFVPEKVAGSLDFVAVHLYPEEGKLDEAIETLQAFAAVGKPVVIEETFPLKASPDQFANWLRRTRPHATGWIGFYWGSGPDELRRQKTIQAQLMLRWLEIFQAERPE